jgi:hypothetical protein
MIKHIQRRIIMPSVIGTDSGSGVNVAANYLKTKPSTQFGTRQLSVLNIAIADVFVNHANADSLFSKSVRALQQTAEVWSVFTPVDGSPDSFNVIISTDSQWDGDSANQGAVGGLAGNGGFGILETAIAAGNGGVSTAVTVVAGFVAPFQG